jgi:integral membrane protein
MVEERALAEATSGLEREQLKRLEMLSIVEATTLVVLVCIAVPLNHIFGWPLGSRILGPIHGLAFLAYCWMVLQTVTAGCWRGRDIARLFAVAFVPFAGYFNIAWLRRKTRALKGAEAG